MARDAKLTETKLSHTAALILQALDAGFVYGFSIMEMIRSHWERQSIADAEQRPPRKYYKLTASGNATLEASRRRYPLLERLIPSEEARTV
jgi:hypothetical protein